MSVWGVYLQGSVRQTPEEDFRLIESAMKKVASKRVKREEAQPESAKPSEKSEPEIEAAIMALPIETQTLHDRLGEMLEEFGSWVDYRVRLDEEVLVVAFDVCSSSMIMEQLLLGGDLSCLTDLLTAIKRHLAAEQKHLLFDPYKFTGDGWILLFPANTDGSALMAFLERLCRFYSDKYRRLIKPNLQNVLKIVGLSFGIDRGWVSRMKMYGQTEYIGRPIIVACRLQGAVKDKGGSRAYEALVTYHAYRKHFTHLPASRAVRVKRILRNINAETPFGCKKIALLSR